MGGKNALIIDDDADPDQAVPAAVRVGVRVRRAEVLGGQPADRASARSTTRSVERVVGAHPRAAGRPSPAGPRCRWGRSSTRRPTSGSCAGSSEAPQQGAPLRLQRDDVPDEGYFVGPDGRRGGRSRRADRPRGDLRPGARPCCGPTTSTRPSSWPTRPTTRSPPGIFSRSPADIRRAAAELRAGNVYINRHITGAVVGRQPFGGYGMSGVGSKAGGPDYLLPVPRPPGRHREHAAPGLRPRDGVAGRRRPVSTPASRVRLVVDRELDEGQDPEAKLLGEGDLGGACGRCPAPRGCG